MWGRLGGEPNPEGVVVVVVVIVVVAVVDFERAQHGYCEEYI